MGGRCASDTARIDVIPSDGILPEEKGASSGGKRAVTKDGDSEGGCRQRGSHLTNMSGRKSVGLGEDQLFVYSREETVREAPKKDLVY